MATQSLGRVVLLAVLASLACTGDEQVVLADQGYLCVLDEGGSASFVEGAPVEMNVVLEDCASGCASDIMASCSVSQAGTTLSVSAEGSYTIPGGNPDCATVCVPVSATCLSEPLPAGSYTVEYAGNMGTLDIPSDVGVALGEPNNCEF